MVDHCDLRFENLLLDSKYIVNMANFEFGNIMQGGQFLKANDCSSIWAALDVHVGCEVDVWNYGVVLSLQKPMNL
jgi:serine/threonine protein kinase